MLIQYNDEKNVLPSKKAEEESEEEIVQEHEDKELMKKNVNDIQLLQYFVTKNDKIKI